MDGASKKTLTNEDMLAEARAFRNEVSRGTDRRGGRTSNNMASSGRGFGGMSSPNSGAYSSGDRSAAGTPRGVSSQPAPPKLATPEQLFGLPSRLPASVPQKPSMPVTQPPAPRPMEKFDPMQVDSHSGMPQVNKIAKETTGRGLVSSRWATSVTPNTVSHTKPVSGFDGMDVDTELHVTKKVSASNEPVSAPNPGANISNLVPASSAHAVIANDSGNVGVTPNKGKSSNSSFSKAALDTPEASGGSKGLLSSRWAFASPSSPSPMTTQYPDPATLEPVYRSKDWLSDLTEEYKALSVKAKNASETQPTPISPAAQPAGTQRAIQTVNPPNAGPTAQRQPFGQTTVDSTAASQGGPSVQTAGRPVAVDAIQSQTFDRRTGTSPAAPTGGSVGFHEKPIPQHNTIVSPAVELGRTPDSAQTVSDQSPAPTTNTAPGGIFNDSSFKDWYNSQFMRRKA